MLFAQSFHVWLGGYHIAAAAALAWAFLATERWIFFFRLRDGTEDDSRQAAEQRTSMVRICLLIVAGLVLVAFFRAHTREIAGMLIWTSLGGAYLLGIRLKPEQVGEILPREMALAIYLAGTVVLFTWASAAFAVTEILLPGMLFLLLLFYYFSLAVLWAKPLAPPPSTGPLFESPLGMAFRAVPVSLIFAGVFLAFLGPAMAADRLLITVGVSGLILVMLDVWQDSLDKAAARILADVALLTPVIPLLVGL